MPLLFNKYSTSAVIAVIAAVLSVFLACATMAEIKIVDKNKDKLLITTDHIEIEVLGGGNVPKFRVHHLALDETTDSVYKVMMQHAFQTTSDDSPMRNKVPGTETSLPSLEWDFSPVEHHNDSLNFNITSTSNAPQFQFRVHVNDVDASIKFDTVINGMTAAQWKDASTHYATCFKIIQQRRRGGKEEDLSAEPQVKNGREMRFGSGRFEIEETAQTDEKHIKVRLTSDKEGSSKMACVVYDRWEGDMVHDPTFGVSSGAMSMASSTKTTLALVGSLLLMMLVWL